MLTIVVPGVEHFDEDKQEFVTVGDVVLDLEHSLVSLSKWESKYEKPFLGNEKSTEETIGYVKCMVITPDVPEETFDKLTDSNLISIQEYLDAKMTATWFSEAPGAPQTRDVITAELIYYWMISLGIPFECQYWHLNRLLMLIKVCNIKNSPKKKISFNDRAKIQRDLNDQRRSELGSSG